MKKNSLLLLSIIGLIFMSLVLLLTISQCTSCYAWFSQLFRGVFDLFTQIMPRIFFIIFILIIFQLISKFVIKGVVKSAVKGITSEGRTKVIIQFTIFIWWAIFAILSIIILVGNIGSLLTSLGLIGLGLTFALQKPIMNLVGYITIAFNGVYSEGDRIRIGNIRGDVKEIRLMNTFVDGLLEGSGQQSGKLLMFPNEFVLTQEVENYTKTSNYILEELKIGITYESNYQKAMKLLEQIVTDRITKSRIYYRKNIMKQERVLNLMLKSLQAKKKSAKGKSGQILTEQELKLRAEKEKLADEKRELEEEFKPKIRMEFLDSCIELTAFFQAPYDKIKLYRSQINFNFINAIREEGDVEIAYPHMQLVIPESKLKSYKKNNKQR